MTNLLQIIKDNPYITEKELSIITGYHERTIRRYIKKLKDDKKILLLGRGKQRKWLVIK